MLGLIAGLIYCIPASYCIPDTVAHIRYTFRSSHVLAIIYFYTFNKFYEDRYTDKEKEVVHGLSSRMDLSISALHATMLTILKHTHHLKPIIVTAHSIYS